MKKIFFILGLALWLMLPVAAIASNDVIEFSAFTRDDCSHCVELKEFLETDFAERLPNVQPKYYDLADPDTYDFFTEFTGENDLPRATPTILIGDRILQGFESAETTGEYMIELASQLTESSYFEDYEAPTSNNDDDGLLIHLPWLGTIDFQDYSIPVLAIILGFVDGFNPCAMWVLVMFLVFLSQTGSRKKMLILAGIFIAAETIMYYLILNFWYTTWDFVKLDQIVTPIIGVVSIGAGAFFLWEFFRNKGDECKVTTSKHKDRITEKIKKMVNSPLSIGVFFSILGVAFSVNIIEFACSIGIPQAFTKVLELNYVNSLMRQVYILIYTLFYMIDDLIVFGIAIWSFKYLHLTTKYTRYCLLIGGIVMLLLGYFFVFDPSKLIF
ncbi:glutaredoxin [Candidatus Peregrinibacteria bacterium CG22_combo_CG10-13_8_21_14_all_44_10]|nr:MAG: glutaredoxin [Candidatus Peregrinibacteria bacterium CG22_combo_CG10-13_8_21_14_all_44_10]PIS04331.1 MAG: glutaredoxin [Candidatus Peregrinibacteria bacterium CG10_big_fil_rev_8_21_14_0_10_44_7]PIX79018.1 MAG: glutaredoxin [Candidatus Peregrinibacteria bacterium CG_4_10_14_3_um_filter_44_21]PJB89060.1 MAG: glutaredoxin [Candidatus Peregrinibacteria bacterium CG_4_9_14_0_8_um_filter_44_15]